MKDLGKEQIFFLVTLVLLGSLAAIRLGSSTKPAAVRPARPLELPPAPLVPEPLDIDPKTPFIDDAARDVFASPREWVPLDAVALALPPVEAPGPMPPPPVPAADVPHWGCYRVPGAIQPGAPSPGEAPPGVAPAALAEEGEGGEAEGLIEDTRGSATGTSGASVPRTDTEREAALKKQWDWVLVQGSLSPLFGLVVNEDKWSLEERPSVDLQIQLLAKGGTLGRPQLLKRDRVEKFGFAETALNRFHLEWRDLRRSGAALLRRLEFVKGWLEQARLGEGALLEFLAAECDAIIAAAQGSAAGQAMGHRLGEVYATLGAIRRLSLDREGEREAYERGLAAGLQSPVLYRAWGRFLAGYGLFESAEAMFRKAASSDRNDVESARALAEFLLRRGCGAEALQSVATALKRDIEPALKIRLLADAASAALFGGMFEEAAEHAQRALHLAVEGDAEALLVAAAIDCARERPAEAANKLEEALRVAKAPDARIHYSLGVVLARLGRFAEARAELERSAFLDPLGAVAPQRALAYIAELEGDDVRSLELLEEAVAMAPADPYSLYLLGRATRRNGDLEGSLEILRRSLRIEGRALDTLRELGFVSLELGLPNEAAFYLNEVALCAPDDFETTYLIGLSHAGAGRLAEAAEAFSRARVGRSEWAAPLNGLAYVQYRTGRVTEALEQFAAAARMAEPFNSVHAAYAAEARGAIASNLSKQQWIDRFAWRDLANEWRADERYGATLKTLGSGVELSGVVKAEEPVRTALWRMAEAKGLVSLEADLQAGEGNRARYGISLMIEKSSGDRMVPRAEIALAREVDGRVTFFFRDSENSIVNRWDELAIEHPQPAPSGATAGTAMAPEGITFRIERVGDPKEFKYQLYVNDRVQSPTIELRAAKGRSVDFKLSVFADADPGEKVLVRATRARLVRLRAES
ncbi:MAG: tetratricopeptide repeat protein [Planctomycetota bacterium]